MIRIITKLGRSFGSFRFPQTDSDIANMSGYLQASDQPTLTFMEKLSTFSPSNMYHGLDEFSREILFTVANDYKLGLPMAIIAISLVIKGAFFYPNIKGQVIAIKMRQVKPHLERFQQKMKIGQMSRNKAMMKEAQRQFAEAKRKKGIDNFYSLINLMQIPFLITWFLSLRYVTIMPEIFPEVLEPFLWMDEIVSHDPYFILPLFSATCSSYGLSISPALNTQNVTFAFMAPFIKYMKYIPFLSLPITGFFPAALNIYWATLALSHAVLMQSMSTKFVKKSFGMIQQHQASQVSKAVFVEEKPKVKEEPESAQQAIPKENQQQPQINYTNAEKVNIVSHRGKKNKKK